MHKKAFLGLCICVATMSTAYAQMDSQTAYNKLSVSAKQKIAKGGINLQSLLKNDSNDLIVEYNVQAVGAVGSAQSRQHYGQVKKQYQSQFQRLGGIQLLREYNALPVSFHRINHRNTLVQLLNDPNVKAVYPNIVSRRGSDQSYELIGQTTAASRGFKADGTTVVVMDTGANYNHADFGNCTAPNMPSTCRVSHSLDIATDDLKLDTNGHGSNVAAIVAKVAPNTKIVSLDVFRDEYTYNSDMISALNWVANNARALNIKAVNLSIVNGTNNPTTCTSSALTNSFNSVRNVGVIPVVSSGNDGYTTGISYPACTAGAVSVGAVYDKNVGAARFSKCSDSSSFSDKTVCFSNNGPNLTLLAPGAFMDTGGYTFSGTSQAAPHVAGAIAVLRANNAFPNETIEQTIERLKNNATWVTDQRNNVRYPRLNLWAALNGASGQTQTTTPTPEPQPTPEPEKPVVTSPVVTPPVVTQPTPAPAPQRVCRRVLFWTICSG